jgi:hypothetical protein
MEAFVSDLSITYAVSIIAHITAPHYHLLYDDVFTNTHQFYT